MRSVLRSVMCSVCVRHVAGPSTRLNMSSCRITLVNPARHHQRPLSSSYAWVSKDFYCAAPLAVEAFSTQSSHAKTEFQTRPFQSARTLGGVVLARVLILCVAALFFTSISSHVGPSCLFGLPAPKCPLLVYPSRSAVTVAPRMWSTSRFLEFQKKLEVEKCGTRGRLGLDTKQPDHNLLRLAQLCINFSCAKWQLRGLSGVPRPRTVCHRWCSFALEPTRSDVADSTENNVPMTAARRLEI